MGRFEEALPHLERASRGLPRRPRILYNLGLLQLRLGRAAAAGEALERALAVEPENLDFLFALADLLVRTGRFDEARRMAGRMLRVDPSSSAARQILQFLDGPPPGERP